MTLATEENVRAAVAAAPDPLAIWRRVAAREDAKPAIIHWRHPSDPAPDIWSYERCLDTATRLAGALRAHGVTREDIVAIVAPSIPETMVALLAVIATAVAFPINTLLSAKAVAAQLALARAKVVITLGRHPAFDLHERVNAAFAAVPDVGLVIEIDSGQGSTEVGADARRVGWDDFLHRGTPVEEGAGPADRAAALFHTGGTTGAPKLAELSLGGIVAGVHMSAAGIGVRPSDRVLNLLPFFHVGGAFAAGAAVFCAGGSVLTCGLAGARNPDLIKAIWATAATMQATLIGMVPSTWSLVASLPAPPRLPALRGMVTGATSMAPELALQLEALAGVPMTQVYGMSETSGIVSTQPADGTFRAPCVGRPVPLIEMRLEPIAPDGPSEVMIRGPNLFRGYRTAEGLVEAPDGGWIASGDLGAFGEDGQLRLAGRRKDVIVRGGHNIDPLSIEDTAQGHPDVVASAAVGMPDIYAGEVPVLYVVPRPDSALVEDDLAAFLAAKVAEPPARPRRIVLVPELPLTPVGKIARYRLRQRAAATRAAEAIADLSPRGVDCDDYAARRVTIRWAENQSEHVLAEAEARLSPLGLCCEHRRAE